MGVIHDSSVGSYKIQHINALQSTAVAVGNNAATTSTTAVSAPGSTVITPASMAAINVGDWLNIFGGTGTAEYVQVTAITSTTFTAVFANTHSGTYNIVTRRGVYLGYITFNQPGTSITITLYNGYPGSQDTGNGVMAAITPSAVGFIPFQADCPRGLFYTVTGTTAGDYSIAYIDKPAN